MTSAAVENMMRFCENANIDHRQIGQSVRKYLLSYQRNILHKGAFTALFGEAFMNWEYVERSLPKLDCAHWLAIFKYIDFSKVPRNKSVLQNIEQHLVQLKLDPNLACHIFLLKNTNFITSQLGVERLLCEYETDDAYNKSLQFFAMSADAAFDMKEMTAVFCHIMQLCEVDEAELEKQIQFVNLKEEELAASFKVKQIRMVGGRPRLRSKLTAIQKEVKSVRDLDNFDSWSQTIGFPSVFSLHMRHRLYFLMAQPYIADPLEYVSLITRDMYVHNALKTAVVSTPEHDVLYKVIVSLKLTDEPFKELHEFRCECINAFPVMQLNAMRLNDLLHLYVCAYQHQSVWKEIWKQLIPLLSHQVIRDVETFVQKRPFNYLAVLEQIDSNMTSVQHSKQIAFWKKHQTLLKHCADLSKKCDVKILCVITVPNRYIQSSEPSLVSDPVTGNIKVESANGNTVIFDSFSSEDEVKRRNMVTNSISKINEPSRHFPVGFNVSVSAKVAAVLSPSTVESYLVVDRRATLPPDARPDEVPRKKQPYQEAKPIEARLVVSSSKMDSSVREKQTGLKALSSIASTLFDEEIARRKRQCAILLQDDDDIFQESGNALSTSKTDQKRHKPGVPLSAAHPFVPVHHFPAQFPVIPASTYRIPFGIFPDGSPYSSQHATPNSSSEVLICCTVPERVKFPQVSNEEIAAALSPASLAGRK